MGVYVPTQTPDFSPFGVELLLRGSSSPPQGTAELSATAVGRFPATVCKCCDFLHIFDSSCYFLRVDNSHPHGCEVLSSYFLNKLMNTRTLPKNWNNYYFCIMSCLRMLVLSKEYLCPFEGGRLFQLNSTAGTIG